MYNLVESLSEAEYLEFELHSNIRHEYVDGQVYAMSGGSEQHSLIAVNLYTLLRTKLRGTGCRVFSSDMKIWIPKLKIFYYPDLSVVCDAQDRERYYKSKPCLIIEVLSPSTQRIDRQEKLRNFSLINTLQEYVLISQDRPRVTIHRRLNDWSPQNFDTDSVLFDAIGLEIAIADIYEDIEFAT
jgi:Uma2 family endonuclease